MYSILLYFLELESSRLVVLKEVLLFFTACTLTESQLYCVSIANDIVFKIHIIFKYTHIVYEKRYVYIFADNIKMQYIQSNIIVELFVKCKIILCCALALSVG